MRDRPCERCGSPEHGTGGHDKLVELELADLAKRLGELAVRCATPARLRKLVEKFNELDISHIHPALREIESEAERERREKILEELGKRLARVGRAISGELHGLRSELHPDDFKE